MTLLEEIRKETAVLHQRLDKLELTKQLMREQVSLNDYVNYIQCFYALHHQIEPVLYPKVAGFFPEILKNQRLQALKQDLELLDVPELIIELPIELHHFSEKACVGALYVMEGARLGGRFIAKHLRNSITVNQPSQFKYLEESPPIGWKDILRLVSTSDENENVKIIESAKYMFKFVEELLEKAFVKVNEENKL